MLPFSSEFCTHQMYIKNVGRVQHTEKKRKRTYRNVGAPNHNWCTKSTISDVQRSDTIILLTPHQSTDTSVPKMPRQQRYYTNREKIHFLAQIDERGQLSGETLRSCCRHFDLAATITGETMEEVQGGLKQPCCSKQGVASF